MEVRTAKTTAEETDKWIHSTGNGTVCILLSKIFDAGYFHGLD